MSPLDNKPIDTLRLDERDKHRILDELAVSHSNMQDQGRPRDLRVPYKNTRVTVTIANPGGNVVTYCILPRNLSRQGIGFLHGRFVYPNSPCSITLRTLDNETITCEGEIVRCRHISGTIHDVGVRFSVPVDLSLFTRMSTDDHESLTAEIERDLANGTLTSAPITLGHVLIVDPGILDRKFITAMLERQRYTCYVANHENQAMELADAQTLDLAIIDVSLEPAHGLDLITQLNTSAFKGSILAISVDTDDATREAALNAGAHKFLPKPINNDTFNDLLNQLLRSRDADNSNPILSTYRDDESMKPLIDEYVCEVHKMINELRDPTQTNTADMVRQVCRTLIGASDSYGFETVTINVRDILSELDNIDNNSDQVRPIVDSLLNTLARVRAE